MSVILRTFKTEQDVKTLRSIWKAAHRDADLDFFLFIARTQPACDRLHVMALYDDESPKAILAGRFETRRLPIRLGYLVVPSPRLRILNFVYGGCIGDFSDANAKIFVDQILSALSAGEADAVMFHYLSATSTMSKYARTLPSVYCADHFIAEHSHWIRDKNVGAGFIDSLPKKERYHQRNRTKLLRNDFHSVTVETFQTPEQIHQLARDADLIARKSYQHTLGVGFSNSDYVRRRLEYEALAGWLRGHVLYLDSIPVAFWIGSRREGTFYSDYLAFDPRYAKYSPGLYLIVNVIEGMTDATRIDFGGGDASYKERLATTNFREATIFVFAPTAKGIAVNILRAFSGGLTRMAFRLRLHRVKRVWRSMIAK
jgi:hypothetical protein